MRRVRPSRGPPVGIADQRAHLRGHFETRQDHDRLHPGCGGRVPHRPSHDRRARPRTGCGGRGHLRQHPRAGFRTRRRPAFGAGVSRHTRPGGSPGPARRPGRLPVRLQRHAATSGTSCGRVGRGVRRGGRSRSDRIDRDRGLRGVGGRGGRSQRRAGRGRPGDSVATRPRRAQSSLRRSRRDPRRARRRSPAALGRTGHRDLRAGQLRTSRSRRRTCSG